MNAVAAGCMTPTTRFLTIEDATHADSGDEVRIVMADGREITGTVGASDDRTVVIDGIAGHKRVSIDEIKSMQRHVYTVSGKSKPHDAGAAVVMSFVGIGALVGLGFAAAAVVKSFQGFKGFGY